MRRRQVLKLGLFVLILKNASISRAGILAPQLNSSQANNRIAASTFAQSDSDLVRSLLFNAFPKGSRIRRIAEQRIKRTSHKRELGDSHDRSAMDILDMEEYIAPLRVAGRSREKKNLAFRRFSYSIQAQSSMDFKRKHICILDGWVLSNTEADVINLMVAVS